MLIIRRSKPASNFTILPNELLRDDRLSYCARGVLGELLSRPTGWETNADALSERARRRRDGKGEGRRAMRAAFAELEAAGYMIRKRERIARGEVGGGNFVTVLEVYDTPQHGGTGCGTSIDGTSIGGTSMGGTSSRSTEAGSTDQEDGGKKILSPPLIQEQRAAEPAPASERETSATPTTTTNSSSGTAAERVVRAASIVSAEEESAFIAWATATHQPRGGAWWRTVAANGDLADLAAAWRTEQAPAATQSAARPAPPWCGRCDADDYRWTCDTEGRWAKCGTCNPDTARRPAVSREQQQTDDMFDRAMARARARDGHTPFQPPTDHSVYENGWGGRPLPGTDTKIAG